MDMDVDLDMNIPVEVLRGTNSNDSVGIGQAGEDADPASVSGFIFLSSWRGRLLVRVLELRANSHGRV